MLNLVYRVRALSLVTRSKDTETVPEGTLRTRKATHLQVFVVHLLLVVGRRRWHRFGPPEDAAALRRVGHVVWSVLELVLPVHVCPVSNQGVQNSLRRRAGVKFF